jgi:hypothetical protein
LSQKTQSDLQKSLCIRVTKREDQTNSGSLLGLGPEPSGTPTRTPENQPRPCAQQHSRRPKGATQLLTSNPTNLRKPKNSLQKADMAPSGSTSPTAPVVGNTRLRKTTANKLLLATSKSIEEHIDGTSIRTDITNIITAKKLLNTHGLALPTAGTMLKQIVTVIFEFSALAGLGSTHTEILRGIAMVLYDAERMMDMTNIINKIKTLIGGPLTIMVEKAEELVQSTDKHKEALEEAVKEVHTNLSESLERIDKATKNATQAIQNRADSEIVHNGSEGPRSYAAAAKVSIPGPLTKLLSRNEGQTRQILIDRRSLFMPKDAITQLTE